MGKRIIIIILSFIILNPILSNEVFAKPVVLKLSHQWATSDVRAYWAEKWSEMVTDRSNGEIKVQIYPAQSLLKAKMQYDALRSGNIDACLMVTSYLEGKIPEVGVAALPTIIKNEKQGIEWGRREIGSRLNELAKKNGFDIISWTYLTGSVGSKKKEVVVPEDIDGLKVRGASSYYEEMMRAAGASVTSMPSSEVYFAAQTGVLDGLITTYSSFVSFRLYEVLDHLSVSEKNDIYGGHVWMLISNVTMNKLSDKQKKIVTEAGREVEHLVLDRLLEAKKNCIATFEKNNVKVHYISPEDFEKWKAVAKKSSYELFKKKVKDADQWIKMAEDIPSE